MATKLSLVAAALLKACNAHSDAKNKQGRLSRWVESEVGPEPEDDGHAYDAWEMREVVARAEVRLDVADLVLFDRTSDLIKALEQAVLTMPLASGPRALLVESFDMALARNGQRYYSHAARRQFTDQAYRLNLSEF